MPPLLCNNYIGIHSVHLSGSHKHVVLYMKGMEKLIYYVLVIAPLGGMLLLYRPETRGRVAPEGGGSINRQHTDYGCYNCFIAQIPMRLLQFT